MQDQAPSRFPSSESSSQPRPSSQPSPHDAPYLPLWLTVGSAWGWRFAALCLGLYIILRICILLWVAVLPVILGAILASLLEPVARGLRRLRIPRSIAGALSVLSSLAVLAGVFFLFGFGIAGEMDKLAEAAESGYRQLVQWSAQLVGVSQDAVHQWVDSHLQDLQSYTGSIAKQVATSMQSVFQGIAVLAVMLVFTWFFTWDGDRQFAGAVELLPERKRQHARLLGKRVWATVGGYMRGMVVIAAADALLLGLGLWAIGLPLVLPLMLLMFIGAFVPFVGPILAGGMAVLVALGNGGLTSVGLVLVVTFAVQQIEGNFLHPFIMGRAVKLHPALVLFAITAGGVLAGVVGVFLAIPVAASIATVLGYMREQHAQAPLVEP